MTFFFFDDDDGLNVTFQPIVCYALEYLGEHDGAMPVESYYRMPK